MTTFLINKVPRVIASRITVPPVTGEPVTGPPPTVPLADSAQRKTVRPFRFLIVGYSQQQHTKDKMGLWVANAVTAWQVPAVRAITVSQLTPALVNEMTAADYVIFVTTRLRPSRCQSVRVEPVVIGPQPLPDLAAAYSCTPQTLLNLVHQLYDHVPLSWLIQVPKEPAIESKQGYSTVAQRGDRALQTIEQFFRTYRC